MRQEKSRPKAECSSNNVPYLASLRQKVLSAVVDTWMDIQRKSVV